MLFGQMLGDAATDAAFEKSRQELRARSAAWPVCVPPVAGNPNPSTVTAFTVPLGVVPLAFGFALPMSEFISMGPKQRTINERDLVPGAYKNIESLWLSKSRERWNQVINTLGPGGTQPNRAMSLQQFVQHFPEFAIGEYAGYLPTDATNDELTKSGGVGKYAGHSGGLLWKPIFDGLEPLTTTIPMVCLEGCRSSFVSETWPGGTPQCRTKLTLETNNFTWGLFVKRDTDARVTFVLKRLPKNGWDHLEDGVVALVDAIRTIVKKLCDNQILVSVAAGAGGGPGGALAAQTAMARFCNVTAAVPPAQLPVPPPTAPATGSWFKQPAVIIGVVGAIAAVAFLVRPR